MQKDDFLQILDDNSKAILQKDALLEMEYAFKFDANSKILAAKIDFQSQSMYAEKKLKQAALFSPNRAFLKKKIQDSFIENIPNEVLIKEDLFKEIPLIKSSENISTNLNLISKDENLIDEIEEKESKIELKLPEIELETNQKTTEIDNLEEFIIENSPTIEVINQENNITKDTIFSGKYYVHTPVFGTHPKVSSDDLIKEFLSYRGVIEIEKVDFNVQQSIIQKFLEDEPVINRLSVDSEVNNKTDLSKTSTIESEFITENYANILIKQKKINKAIEIYYKLILKYPEKETYFAEKISLFNSYNQS